MWQCISRLLPLLLLSVGCYGKTPGPNLCRQIETGRTEDFKGGLNWKNCTLDEDDKYYGSKNNRVRLDFSSATEAEITEFFTKPGSENATLSAGIILLDNDNIETINLGNIAKWEALEKRDAYGNFIHIRGNAKLKRIIWKSGIDLSNLQYSKEKSPRIFIYNNPLLKFDEDQKRNLEIIANGSSRSYLPSADNECVFENKTTVTKELDNYMSPTQELLNNCRVIVNSIFLSNRTLPADITLTGKGCIRLVNVNFAGHRLLIDKHKSQTSCQHGLESAFLTNPNLCGEQLAELYGHVDHYKDKVPIELDFDTCSKSCTAKEANHPYYLCSKIIEEADISSWFLEAEGKFKVKWQQQKLVAATDILIITLLPDKTISLPDLTTVKHLVLTDNYALEQVHFNNLTSVEYLQLANNFNLLFDQFPTAFGQNLTTFPYMDNSTTYCITDKVADEDRVLPPRNENIIITSFEMIRLCTHIKGPLILSDIKSSSKAELFQVEEVDGCVTVENTQLTSLRFMEKVKITGTCLEGHKIVNNPDLCARGYLVDTGITVTETGNKETDCPCIQSDVAKTGGTAANCDRIRLDKEFSCDEYDASRLVEVLGQLIIKNCTNLEATFPKLKKISVDVVHTVPLIVLNSSDPPSLEFLKRIEFHSIKSGASVEIHPKMSVEQFLSIKYNYRNLASIIPPEAPGICFIESSQRYDDSDCRTLEGDLVVRNDKWPPMMNNVREITGCLVVQNGARLEFLKRVQKVGMKCKYGDRIKYPLSPSRGLEKTEIDQMKADYCPLREERERLAEIMKMSSIKLSGKEPQCAKACDNLAQGNCDSYFGDLVITPDVYLKNLEVIYGKLVIVGTLLEEIDLPKLKEIYSPTAPALLIHSNNELTSLKMPMLTNITAADNGQPLIRITGNLKLNKMQEFIPPSFWQKCGKNPMAICYEDNSGSIRGQEELFGWNWALPILLLLLFAIPTVAYLLYQRKRKSMIERRSVKRKRPVYSHELDPTQSPSVTAVPSRGTLPIDSQKSAPSLKGRSLAVSKRSSRIPARTPAVATASSTTTTTPVRTPASRSAESEGRTPASRPGRTPATSKTGRSIPSTPGKDTGFTDGNNGR